MKLFNRVSRRIRSRGRKRPAVHLNFELCEERLLLTTYTVNSTADTDHWRQVQHRHTPPRDQPS